MLQSESCVTMIYFNKYRVKRRVNRVYYLFIEDLITFLYNDCQAYLLKIKSKFVKKIIIFIIDVNLKKGAKL